MKKLNYIFILFTFLSCNGQDKISTNLKNTHMSHEKFDVATFEAFIKSGGDTTSVTRYDYVKEINGELIIEYAFLEAETGKRGYTQKNIPPVPALFYTVKEFDEKGNIKEVAERLFFGILLFDYAKITYFDANGHITKIEDYENDFTDYKVKLEELLQILCHSPLRIEKIDLESMKLIEEKLFDEIVEITPKRILDQIKKSLNKDKISIRGKFEPMLINPKNRLDLERVYISKDDEKKQWIVTKNYAVLGKIELIFSGKTGELLNSTYILDYQGN